MPAAIQLPTPSADELAHSARLQRLIVDEIAAHGPIGFERYMQLALYAPGLGYYSAGRTKFGAAGDFITAPECGDIFAHCVAQAVAPALREQGSCFMELGAGSGAFAADALAHWQQQGWLPTEYLILETSADLRQRQAAHLRARVPDLLPRVRWLDAPPGTAWRGVLFANEVVDALPVQLFAWRDHQLHERVVDIDGAAALCWRERPAASALRDAVDAAIPQLPQLPASYCSEILPQLSAWFAAVAGSLEAGLALFIDYGYPQREYYLAQRAQGTLGCHYRHRFHHDPLWMPGLCDITSWVDFSALAHAGHAAGFDPVCYATQAQFLIAAGLAQVAAIEAPRDAGAQLQRAQQVRTLILPGEMGERFKTLAFARGIDAAALLPWTAIDQSARL